MCGIYGHIGFSHKLMVDMSKHMLERGPDDQNSIPIEDNGEFGHNRLSIIDLSRNGSQPMISERYKLTFNGEIYNYKTLATYVDTNDDMGDYRVRGNDAYTLLRYIEKFGLEKALRDVSGMFAFALYDMRDKRLHLVTDHMGQKPLYYYRSGARIAFASTPGALTYIHDEWSLNGDALDKYWLLGACFGTDTLFRDINKLPAATIATFDVMESTFKTVKYWSPIIQSYSSYDCRHIESLIIESIREVQIADVPVRIFLSGGIDSTLVASQSIGMSAIHLDSPEIQYAREAARKFFIHLDIVDSLRDAAFNARMDEFCITSGVPAMAALIPFYTAEAVQRLNGKVAISANGADELFCGYDRIGDLPSFEQMKHLFRVSLCGDDYARQVHSELAEGDPLILNSGRWLELKTYVEHDLNSTLDFASMANSVEVRNPFLNHRLVSAALSIPASMHIDNQFGRKAILKNMLSKHGFSHTFLTRPKVGFSMHKEPPGLASNRKYALEWCKGAGLLTGVVDIRLLNLTGRDHRYLEASAYSLYRWFKIWGNKIKGYGNNIL